MTFAIGATTALLLPWFGGALAIAGLALVCGAVLSTTASASEGWQEKWKKTVAAAEAEGELIVSGPSGSLWREHLLTFHKAYPAINIKVTPFASRTAGA